MARYVSTRARPIPSRPPKRNSTIVSVSSCRTRRPRPAPSAARSAISLPRAVARVSMMPATFAQATARTSETSTISGGGETKHDIPVRARE